MLYPQLVASSQLWLLLLRQLYTRGHHCAVNSGADLLLWMSHYHVKRVKLRDWPSVFTTCATRRVLTRAQTQTAEHTDSRRQDTLSLTGWTRNGSSRQVSWRQSDFLHLLFRARSAPLLCQTNLLRNGSELLAVMVRASWAIGEDTGFVPPSWSILVGSWFLRASSCGW